MVGAYGQDDRICAFTSMRALLECQNPAHTALALFVDKEEIGSTGNTGMRARFLENTVAELLYLITGDYDEIYCRKALANAKALSADVGAGIDPGWEGTHDKHNAARLGNGVVITKYTGSGGNTLPVTPMLNLLLKSEGYLMTTGLFGRQVSWVKWTRAVVVP